MNRKVCITCANYKRCCACGRGTCGATDDPVFDRCKCRCEDLFIIKSNPPAWQERLIGQIRAELEEGAVA